MDRTCNQIEKSLENFKKLYGKLRRRGIPGKSRYRLYEDIEMDNKEQLPICEGGWIVRKYLRAFVKLALILWDLVSYCIGVKATGPSLRDMLNKTEYRSMIKFHHRKEEYPKPSTKRYQLCLVKNFYHMTLWKNRLKHSSLGAQVKRILNRKSYISSHRTSCGGKVKGIMLEVGRMVSIS